MARVAVVDDDKNIELVMRETLAGWGWDTNVPVRDNTTFADLQSQHPDAIVLDLWLDIPRARRKLLHHLKRKRSTRDVPVIICTGVPERLADHEQWLHDNDIAVLTIPCDVGDLDRALRLHIGSNPMHSGLHMQNIGCATETRGADARVQ